MKKNILYITHIILLIFSIIIYILGKFERYDILSIISLLSITNNKFNLIMTILEIDFIMIICNIIAIVLYSVKFILYKIGMNISNKNNLIIFILRLTITILSGYMMIYGYAGRL